MADTFDLIILGSGPGGYVAAIRASQLGLKVAIVERERLGGICLNWGCIPTKALLRTSEIYHYMSHAKDYGLKADNIGFDLTAIVDRSRKVAGQLNAGVKGLMKKHKVQVYEGVGALTGKGKLSPSSRATGRSTSRPSTSCRHRCAGARPAVRQGRRQAHLDLSPRDGARRDADQAAGDRLGRDRGRVRQLLPRHGRRGDDPGDAAAHPAGRGRGGQRLHGEAAGQGGYRHPHRLPGWRSWTRRAKGVTASIKGKDGKVTTEEFSHAIVAIGIVPNTEEIGLEALGVETERGHIKVDGFGRTNVEGALRDRRRHRRAVAGAQGEPRGHRLRREDRRRGPAPVRDVEHPRLHLQPPAGRQRRPDRGEGQGGRARGQGVQVPLHRQRQGDRAGRGGRLREDGVRRRRPASCSARTWSAPR